MRAWLMESFGGIGSLRLAQIDSPRAAAGEVVLDVLYAALNPADYYLAEGQYPARPAFPHVLGRDGLGIVREVGPTPGGQAGGTPFPDPADASPPWQVGEPAMVLRGEVGVTRRGTFAEQVVVPVESLVRPPEGWTHEQAACGTLAYLTAWQAITQWTDLPRPAWVLVTGASGGVGVASVQLADALGHRVVALSRSRRKREVLESIGAELAVNPDDPDWTSQVEEHVGGRNIDLVIDNVGGEQFLRLIGMVTMLGRISCVGQLAGPVPSLRTALLFMRRVQVRGVSVGSYTPGQARSAWQSVLRTLGGRRPLVDSVFEFENLPAAFERLRRGPLGKVLLRVGRTADEPRKPREVE